MFLYYSLNIKGYGISVSEFIGVSITSVWYLDLYRVTLCMCSTAFRSEAKMSRQTTLGRFGFEKSISHRTNVLETKVTDLVSTLSRKIECKSLKTVIIKLYCIYRCFNTQNCIYPF